jgi:uncharacterized protein YbjT (DUF2867 family)
MSNKILVVGASGHVGRHLVQALLDKGEQVRAASRSGKDMGTAESVVFDYLKPETTAPAFEGVDRAYIMIAGGYTGADTLLKPLIAEAARRGVKVVLQTAWGVNADDSIPLRQVEIALEQSGVPYVILRPNWFMDNFHNFWKPGIDQGVVAVPAGEGHSAFIDVRDVAAVAAVTLTTDTFDGQALNLSGPQSLSYAEAATVLSEVLGRTITYTPVSDSDFIPMLTSAGLPQDYAEFLTSIFYPVREGWTAAVNDIVATVTGRPAIDLKTYVQDHKDDF